MSDRPINPDREQQRADNVESRRQSGLEPRPEDREEEQAGETSEGNEAERTRGEGDDLRRRVELASGGEPAAGLAAEREGRAEEREGSLSPDGVQPDEVTEADSREQTRRAERIQQSGEGIHGVSTQGREDQDAEDEVRRATEGREEPAE